MSEFEEIILGQLHKIEARHKHELDAIYKRQKLERAEIDAALRAVREVSTVPVGSSPPKAKMKLNDAVVEAVNRGCKKPKDIFDFIKNQLGTETTINSVRVRVSKLLSEGLIGRDAEGYAPAKKLEAPDNNAPEASNFGGEVYASPNRG